MVALLVVASPAAAAVPEPFRFQDPEITESSAIVVVGSTYFTINDSGDSARVFAVDREGRTVGVTTYGADVEDVEALAKGPGKTLMVGDIGDNKGERDHITIYRMPRYTSGNHSVRATSYDLVYADGPRDAETLLVHPRTGRVYVVSKGLLGGTVYRAPKRLRADGVNVLRPVGDAPGMVTDGTFFNGGRHVMLRDYSNASVLARKGWGDVGSFRLPAQQQGEGIDVVGDRVVLSTEGEFALVSVRRIPAWLLADVNPEPARALPARPEEAEARLIAKPDSPADKLVLVVGAAVALLSYGAFRLRRR